jgi:hypothetical protein
MTIDESDLTLDQAQSHALSALAEQWPELSLRLAEGKTLTREFGWVFTVEVAGVRAARGPSRRWLPTLVLVAKASAQVVSTSRPWTPAQFAQQFESLFASSRANARAWCLTMTAHVDGEPDNIAERARRAGLEQLKAGRMPDPT